MLKLSGYCFLLLLLTHVILAQNAQYGTGAGNSGNQNSSFGYSAGDKVTGSQNVYLGAFEGYYGDFTEVPGHAAHLFNQDRKIVGMYWPGF